MGLKWMGDGLAKVPFKYHLFILYSPFHEIPSRNAHCWWTTFSFSLKEWKNTLRIFFFENVGPLELAHGMRHNQFPVHSKQTEKFQLNTGQSAAAAWRDSYADWDKAVEMAGNRLMLVHSSSSDPSWQNVWGSVRQRLAPLCVEKQAGTAQVFWLLINLYIIWRWANLGKGRFPEKKLLFFWILSKWGEGPAQIFWHLFMWGRGWGRWR